jgi:ubiquinone/menaquinone biosynthesis C-methylase UbiE
MAGETGREADFWSAAQPGFRFSKAEVGSAEFFAEVERHRYSLEPHIRSVVDFPRWRDKDVLEAGCGIATDGLQFARAGARYTGLDRSERALELATRRFSLEQAIGAFVEGSVDELPFADATFDLVYSHGVIHHIPETERAIAEFHRVLRPGGTAIVMVYHRDSLNYHVNIMVIRRVLVGALVIPGAPEWIARLTREDPAVLAGHRRLLAQHGRRYLTDRALFLSNNTDGPGNPLSKVYTRSEFHRMFAAFDDVRTDVRFLNLRLYPAGERLARAEIARRLERRYGWHLYVEARKAA